jgi:hypothetical protein
LSCIAPAIFIHGFFDWFQFITAFTFHSARTNPDSAFDVALFFMTLAPFGFAYVAYKVMTVNVVVVVRGGGIRVVLPLAICNPPRHSDCMVAVGASQSRPRSKF